MPKTLRIGVDLDNTVVCYDGILHRLALERRLLLTELPVSKENIRQHLCRDGMESVWTEMQGEAYGPHMAEAVPFPGALEFLVACRQAGATVFVVSHRTAVPFAGTTYDLHDAARRWLATNGVSDVLANGRGAAAPVYLETTRSAKLQRITELQLDYFVDDLAAVLLDPDFPKRTIGVHFDPGNNGMPTPSLLRADSWNAVQRFILVS